MLKTETVIIHGIEYVRTWSDGGFMIARDGNRYEEAIDPVETGRIYTETDVEISDDMEADAQDYQSALSEFGVMV